MEEKKMMKLKMKKDYGRKESETSKLEVIEFPIANKKGRRSKRIRREEDDVCSVWELGESSKSAVITCETCREPRPRTESFSTEDCTHCYCSECMVRYVVSKIQENVIHIRCPEPDCECVLDPKSYRSILPWQVFDRWSTALFESLLPWSQRLYCPYEDCLALLGKADRKEFLKKSECPRCGRLFCAQCEVPWHYGLSCKTFQSLKEDESQSEGAMLKSNLDKKKIKKNIWQKCLKCNLFIMGPKLGFLRWCRCKHVQMQSFKGKRKGSNLEHSPET